MVSRMFLLYLISIQENGIQDQALETINLINALLQLFLANILRKELW